MQGRFKMESYRLLTIVRYNYRDYNYNNEISANYSIMFKFKFKTG